jgi:hypothetical protein
MGERAELRRRAVEPGNVCPSCGREATTLASGHCLYCLQPLAGGAGHVETGKILHLGDFDRARGHARRSRGRKAARSGAAMLVGLVVGALLVSLFYLGLRWLIGFFGKGTAWRS